MALHLRPVLLFMFISAVPFTNALNQTLPGCQSRCGNFSIPYPFGMGKGCYRDKGFEIVCKTKDLNNATLAPFLGITGSEIIEISLEQVRVHGPSIFKCYDRSGEGERGGVNNLLDLSKSPFTFSNTRNKLVAVGCDIFSYISDSNNEKYTSGCASLCNSKTVNIDVLNGSCFGIGCCQTTIPRGLVRFNLSVDSVNTPARSWASDSNGCSFAALHYGGTHELMVNYSVAGGINNTIHTSTAALDWAIGYESCQDLLAWNASGIIECAHNSNCLNSTTGFGYRCGCLKGYQGNPYLRDGCQDIDECKSPNPCKKEALCINTAGSYYCECPGGYSGDGLKEGVGCLQAPNYRPSKEQAVLTGIGVCGSPLLLLALGFWLYKKLRKRKEIKLKHKFYKKNGGLLLEQQISSREGNVEKTKIFVTEELERATDNYNESRILGRGGSGTVYKGMLTNGRIVAIKKSKIVDESQTGQFINELVILSQINHRHVVKLLGCCLETEVPLLVYEYISNGTLSHHLHDDALKSSITWEHRIRISVEIARALSYLHSSASTPIFHRDIKSSNVLLDENYRATVGDFGIARSVSYEKTHLTTRVQGTFGYLDPEYFSSGQFTDKSDVYGFGMVLVELLTGEKPVSLTRSEEEQNLAMHFKSSVKEDRLDEILETLVLNEARKEEICVVAKLAKRCLKLIGRNRPTMKEVMMELEGLRRRHQEQPVIRQNYQQTENLVDDHATLTMTWPQSR